MDIIKATKKDIIEIAKIASENFSGLKDPDKAEKWVECNFCAFPRTQYFVCKEKGNISGYIFWIEKGGFRKESVWELEQIAVSKNFQGQGAGTKLIEESLAEIKKYLKKRGSSLKAVEVTTGTENRAQKLYQRTLGAQAECTVKNLFRGDEILMIARFI
ncbi:MAG: GNAT family N-acetyltransferase [Candidatus Staskawiczbacteria bacterium]|nr:GNAT family N-acetyltransferase [Candidatus Staskawiczbacteria bacterium]